MADYFSVVEHVVLTLVLILLLSVWTKEGTKGLIKRLVGVLRLFPGVDLVLDRILASEARKSAAELTNKPLGRAHPLIPIPAKGRIGSEVEGELKALKEKDTQYRALFALVYTGVTDEERFKTIIKAKEIFDKDYPDEKAHDSIVRFAFNLYSHTNALNPTAFPSLVKFETETVSMTAWMLHGDEHVVGSVTSGGTESILSAMKAYRNRARKLYPHITQPEVIAPITIHPAFEKAAEYFGLTMVHVGVDSSYRVDVRLVEEAITNNTILIVASAPQYCHGVIDPITDLGALCLRRDLPLHVDACFGGFILPWVEKLGYRVEPFDFRVPGVTSMSADLHKFGWGPKGTSVLLFKTNEYRRHLYFAYTSWPGGLFVSPSVTGTRPGGLLAAGWASLQLVGQDGYLSAAKGVMEAAQKIKEGLAGIPELKLMVPTNMPCFAVGAVDASLNIYAVADAVESRGGWKMERQQLPACLHFTIMPHHIGREQELVAALKEAVGEVRANPKLVSKGSAAMYGMVAAIPHESLVDDFLVALMGEIFST